MGSSGDVDLLRFVADEGDVQFGVFGSVEREVSRGIGRRTDRSAFDQNRCAYDWRPGRIGEYILLLKRFREGSESVEKTETGRLSAIREKS